MKIILCAHLIVWFTKVSASGDNVSHGIIHIGVVLFSSVFQYLRKESLKPLLGLISLFILGDPALFLGYVC